MCEITMWRRKKNKALQGREKKKFEMLGGYQRPVDGGEKKIEAGDRLRTPSLVALLTVDDPGCRITRNRSVLGLGSFYFFFSKIVFLKTKM